jgi:hypothetical protein
MRSTAAGYAARSRSWWLAVAGAALLAACAEDSTVAYCANGRLTRVGECEAVADADATAPEADAPTDAAPPDLPVDSAPDADATGDDPDVSGVSDASDSGEVQVTDASDTSEDAADAVGDPPAEPDAPPGPCPSDTALVGATCMDLYEAPNVAGALPLVMYHYYEALAWCEARGKRLCYDDEWRTACEGAAATAYPYGNTRQPGVCNDEETWRVYSQTQLNGWPNGAASPAIETVDALFEAARARGASATIAADHVASLYQGEGGGENAECVNEYGVYDLIGNIEEWTTRRDGGNGPDFSGNLKGRYWADTRTCQNNLTSHGNGFRFYEIGFRCCQDAALE